MLTLAIDGTNRAHTCHHATGGNEDDAVRMFFYQLECLIEKFEPNTCIVAFDSKPTFRHKLEPTYKANRTDSPTNGSARGLLVRIWRELEEHETARRCAVAECEADDILATVARMCCNASQRCILVSRDKDLRQCLVSGSVTQLTHFRIDQGQIVDPQYMTAAEVLKRFQIMPNRWIDWQCMVGDKTDGIIGVTGIGTDRATKILTARNWTIDQIVDQPEAFDISKTMQANLKKFKNRLPIVKQLVTLRTDLDEVGDYLK